MTNDNLRVNFEMEGSKTEKYHGVGWLFLRKYKRESTTWYFHGFSPVRVWVPTTKFQRVNGPFLMEIGIISKKCVKLQNKPFSGARGVDGPWTKILSEVYHFSLLFSWHVGLGVLGSKSWKPSRVWNRNMPTFRASASTKYECVPPI